MQGGFILSSKEIITISDHDKDRLVLDYRRRFAEYGYSPKTLGWDKGKQNIRFSILTSQWDLEGKSILDVGCGFGDLNRYIRKNGGVEFYEYTGVDIVEELILEAKIQNPGNGNAKISYICGDFLKMPIERSFDYVISSGVFNRRYFGELDNYSFIEKCIDKSFDLCKEGIAFDFLSDKVDYQYKHTFHSSPERILSYSYGKSRNIILRNDYMPFEFSVFIFKDDSFKSSNTVFNRYCENIN